MRTRWFLALATCVLAAQQGPYQPTTESLRSHPLPRWYDEAKFGIFIHWGVYAVPAFHEWYVEFISPKSNFGFLFGGPPYTAEPGGLPEKLFWEKVRREAVEYHRQRWGASFSYDDFIPMFRAERFNPDEWAALFVDSGARYVVLTAKHGDEFALWPTRYTKRNAMEMGPKRDLAGELLAAVRKRGLKMGFYHNTTYTFYDPRYPGRDWVEYMNNTIKELVDRYQPDILWGDVLVGPVRDQNGQPLPADYWNSKEVLAYFYNHSPNPDEVVANDRWGLDIDGQPLGDFITPERRRLNRIEKRKWETCDSLDPTSWGYNARLPQGMYLTPNEVVDYLVDVVSKNGNLLINIGPRADGTIPEVMVNCLRQVGAWLKVNGEAIYATRPWETYRDGDVRYTARDNNTVYAIALEWPGEELFLAALAGKKVRDVQLLGYTGKLSWEQTPTGLKVKLPASPVGKYAYAFKITLQ